jgi:hypothetical protein
MMRQFGLEGARTMISADALVELLDRLAKAGEQIHNLHRDIVHCGEVPDDADVAIVVARHHIERAAALVDLSRIINHVSRDA